MTSSSGNIVFSVDCVLLCNWMGTETKKTSEKKTYWIKNYGSTTKRVRAAIGQTSSNVFRLQKGFEECNISAGLSTPVVLIFSPEKPEVYHGTIEVFDGEKLVQTISVTASPPCSKFEIQPDVLDFGKQVNENQCISKDLTIKNIGNKKGSFEVISNSPHFELSFSIGNLDSNQSCILTVRLLCNFSDMICDDIRFIFDDGSICVIKAVCNVVQRNLQILKAADHSKLDKLVFKDVFFGDIDVQQIIIFNNSPAYSNFIVTFNSEKSHSVSVGVSLAVAMKSSHLEKKLYQIVNLEDIFQAFPNQGTLAPYQKRTIRFTFTPQVTEAQLGWKSCKAAIPSREYSVIVDILLVDLCNQVRSNDLGTKSFALSATARPVSIEVIPKNINFGTCIIGTSTSKTMEVINLCDALPVKFKCRELAQYRISPSTGIICKEGKAFIQVIFQPTQLGCTTYRLIIDLWADDKVRSKTLSSAVVTIKGNCISACKKNETQLIKRIADVNDLAQSIRPSYLSSYIVTPFTRMPRHSYHDDDYHLKEDEIINKKYIKNSHVTFLRHQYSERKFKKKERRDLKNSKDQDLGMCPGIGLMSPVPKLSSSSLPNLLSSSSKKQSEDASINYIDCSRALIKDTKMATRYCPVMAPNQLENIVVDPPALYFGKVCPNVLIDKALSFTNRNKESTVIKIEIIEDLLQFANFPGKYSMFILLKPSSYTIIHLQISPQQVGRFESCLTYTINGQQSYSILITAQVEKLSVEVLPKTVHLCEEKYYSITSSLWGSVQLTNNYDIPITFKWDCTEEDYSQLYPINQKGVIPANSTMICGFACNPDFSLPSSMKYDLLIGNSTNDGHQLCTEVMFISLFKSPLCVAHQKRVLFSSIPVNLVSSQTLHLENRSDCHAYYKVSVDKNNWNLKVSPTCGYIPGNGALEMNISIHPLIPGLFDVNLFISIRESKCINVRVTGSAEMPNISIQKEVFDFGGVLCGSSRSLPYTISNQGCCRAQLTFDFSCLPDFRIIPQLTDDKMKVITEDNTSSLMIVEIPGKSSTKCELQFRPCQVASYNFYLTILVNGLRPCAPPGSPWPPCNPHSSLSILDEGFAGAFSCTPIRQVLCTALLSPLQINNSVIKFVIPPTSALSKAPMIHHKIIELENVSNDTISWALDTSQNKHLIDNTFKLIDASTKESISTSKVNMPNSILPGKKFEICILFKPENFGLYSENITLYLNRMPLPYCSLSLNGSFLCSTISTLPSHIVLDPVPIGVTIREKFLIILNGFTEHVELDIQLPDLCDESYCAVSFLNGSQSKNRETRYTCVVEFNSLKPISKTIFMNILEISSGIRTRVPVTVAADNSMFSVYEFLAQNMNPVVTLSEEKAPVFHFDSQRNTPLSYSSTSVEQDDVYEFKEMYLKDCVSSLCRWISSNGFSCRKCVNSPKDFCCKAVKDISNTKVKERSYVRKSRGMLVDMLCHLCGRLPPGIPLNLPPCTTDVDKIIQQYSTYDTVLTFLRNQGAILSGILPESLLEFENYMEWLEQKFKPNDFIGNTDEISFKQVSDKAWTRVLMQVIKVLVIPKLLSSQLKESDLTYCSLESLECNLYSEYEMKLLFWLNHHFKAQREALFGSEAPMMKTRQLIHFDVDLMDSMALSCVLYSYCPFLKETHFKKLFVEPSTPEQCSHNALILVDALKNISFSYDIQPSDILSPNPIYMVLFCAHLYSTLALYVPVQEVELSTKLGKKTNTKINISNSTSKTIDYLILIRGNEQNSFSCATNISVPQKESRDLTVTFTCHSLTAKKATLLLVASNSHLQATIVSYSLHGICTFAVPKIQKKTTTHLYEPTSIDLPITTIFKSPNGKYKVNLVEYESVSLHDKTEPYIASSVLSSENYDKVKMFFCSQEINSEVDCLHLEFVGLKLGLHQCYIIIENSEEHTIVLSVIAKVKEPLPMLPDVASKSQHTTVNVETRTVHLNTVIGESIEEDFIIQSKNEAFENALIQMSKWELNERDLNQYLRTNTLKFAALSCQFPKLFGEDFANNVSEGTMTFSIENNSSEHFHLPSVLKIPTHGSAKFPVKFSSSTEGHYECHLLLKFGLDIRVMIIEVTVFRKDSQPQIIFDTYATLPITQKIPIINPSTKDWILNVSILNSKFSGPKKLEVLALSTSTYPLTFNSQKEGKFKGELILVNMKDSSEHIYQLIGNAGRPQAQDYISLQAQVDKKQTYLVHIPNHKDRTVTFYVSSDLDFITGSKEIVVGGDDIVNYCITIFPKKSGLFTGALVFKSADMDFRNDYADQKKDSPYHIWYQVNCEVEPNDPVETISSTCPVMSSKQIDINIVRNTDRSEDLEVLIECDFLSGPSKCSSQDTKCSMIFKPLSKGSFTGRVVFSSSTESEFWYHISLEAVDSEVVTLPISTCELGRSYQEEIILHNPSDKKVNFSCSNSNIRHFSVHGLAEGMTCVDAHSQKKVTLTFKPSTLGSNGHQVVLAFISKEFGIQEFVATGIGVAPSKLESIKTKANLNSSASHTVSFSNPLRSTANLQISLSGKDSNHFNIFARQSGNPIILKEGESIDIAVVFSPKNMHLHQVSLSIATDIPCFCDDCKPECTEMHKICWEYSIMGQPQVILTPFEKAPKLVARTKTVKERILIVLLSNSSSINNAKLFKMKDRNILGLKSISKYTYEIKGREDELLSLIQKHLKVQLIGSSIDEISTMESLTFKTIFSPPKAIDGICELHIFTEEGGLWIVPLQICTDSASPDDIITIESSGLNKVAKATFHLTSTCLDSLPFTTHFMSGSDPEITVIPTRGTLLPSNTNGTQFTVSYKPTMYGRRHSAKFVVQCDVAEWCYEIIGKIPKVKYSHPYLANKVPE